MGRHLFPMRLAGVGDGMLLFVRDGWLHELELASLDGEGDKRSFPPVGDLEPPERPNRSHGT